MLEEMLSIYYFIYSHAHYYSKEYMVKILSFCCTVASHTNVGKATTVVAWPAEVIPATAGYANAMACKMR